MIKRGFNRDKIKQTISQIKEEVSFPFSQVKEEIDEHLAAINENTQEIQANFAFLLELDSKIDKLSQRLDKIEFMLSEEPQKIEVKPLNHPEKQVFCVLYTEEAPLTYEDISNRTGLSANLVREYISALIEKGIPLTKSYYQSRPFLKLDPEFKEMQAKENLVNLSLASYV
ncbi:winged helix-turn-helix domain-containing protein [Candidatus Woesearchaeota archaeon]|nr:winged helix-turn-helix domain-containing protein [Candidatus Woesearchaeota archaeon]